MNLLQLYCREKAKSPNRIDSSFLLWIKEVNNPCSIPERAISIVYAFQSVTDEFYAPC